MTKRDEIHKLIAEQARQAIANEDAETAAFLLLERLIEERCKSYDLECEVADLEEKVELAHAALDFDISDLSGSAHELTGAAGRLWVSNFAAWKALR